MGGESVLSTIFNKASLYAGVVLTVVMGTAMRGDWLLVLVHFWKSREDPLTKHAEEITANSTWLEYFRLQNVGWYILASISFSIVSYYGLAGWLQWHYYIRRRDSAAEWKCQPTKFLTPENERHEILMGSFNLFLGSLVGGSLAAYIMNGGRTQMYYHLDDHSYWYLVFSTVLLFLMQDAYAFYAHKSSHYPLIYKHIHKHHHRYHSPTAFSATAMHPAEFLWLQTGLILPIFFLPVYSGSFIMCILYAYYYGMIDHSGIKMDAVWPWQPPSQFHDDHHKYFHVNFGFNLRIWDWMHDTLRKEDRVYSEEIFGGRGLQKKQVQ
ncbi:hypothetical protein CAPTEDRAFT_221649 [Capitella teleta]|uniref:Fatty acid hydroxylase domain-containing protein n=1 Tax=Capitella teleta TaxID=283909 RepID=R7UVA9_CAPTE|nr:hypothetical protein CAPTEDRAFT_221649 [Capitella teleta]|eukprot:ELU10573.1 hypothetical protein CAPTEDRAFT_221649 [Capitella teleta]